MVVLLGKGLCRDVENRFPIILVTKNEDAIFGSSSFYIFNAVILLVNKATLSEVTEIGLS